MENSVVEGQLKPARGVKRSLARELIVWFLVLSIVPLIAVAWFNYQQTAATLKNAAIDRLNDISALKIHFINNWFDYRFMDLASQAESKFNANLLASFKEEFIASQQTLSNYVKSDSWVKKSNQDGHRLVTLATKYDYIYDIFLIDLQGNLLYSITQESDLGTNLLTGRLKDTEFSKAVMKTLATGDPLFSGIERYGPSNDVLAGFLTGQLLDERGNKQGVIAIQLRLDKVFNILKSQYVSIKTEHHYLVTNEGQLITPIVNKWDEVLKRKISLNRNTGNYLDVMPGQVLEYIGPKNTVVFGTYHPIKVLNTDWLLISEIDIDEALSSSRTLAKTTLFLLMLCTVGVVIIAIYIARKITRPISALADTSMNVAAGKTDQFVDIPHQNEIGQLAESFNHMLKVRQGYEQELQQSSAKTKNALSRLEDQKFALDQHSIVAITDVQGNITFVNEKFSEISGYSQEELVGENHRLLNSGTHDTEFFKDMYHSIANGHVWRGEICNKTKNGALYWVDTTVVPFMGTNNKPISYIAIRTDITESKKSRIELIEAKEGAEIAAQAKSEFLASMSHEIRTPMNGVLGMLGLLKNTELTQDQLHRVNIAQSSGQSLLALINDILDFSKVDAGRMELEYLDFNLRAMLGDFAEVMGHQAQGKGLELILDIKQIEQSQVKGDPGRLRQIITNIVSNAIKFTSEGEIVITAKLQSVDDESWQFYCDVSDTGIGIAQKKIAGLFDSFSQVDASTTREFGGTGLGLAIVKKLCELMDGEVHVSSEEGCGSHFSVKVKLQKSHISQQVLPEIDISKLNLLMVDDNDTNREVLREQLEHWGAVVAEANSGQQALEVCEQRIEQTAQPFFDIAFLDMQMPGMDGAELGKRLKQDERFRKMKLIMMTSMGDRGDERFFADLGFAAYFPKPATTSDLFEALSVVAKGGIVLEQAEPLVTSHYLKMLTPPEKHSLNAVESDHFKKIRILLVEDNQMNQMVATGILNEYGIEMIDIAGNGLEAIESLQNMPESAPYSLILMDCQMPEMDGYQASRLIRAGKAGEHNKTIPIIAMTANAMAGDRDKCLQAGMSDYVAKPVDPDNLLATIMKFLGGVDSSMGKGGADNSENEKLLVWDKDSALNRIRGNEQLLLSLTEIYCKENTNQLNDLQQAIESEGYDQVYHLIHTLKGVAGNLSALKLQSILIRIEALARENNLESIQEVLPEVFNASEELELYFKQYISEQHEKHSEKKPVLSNSQFRAILQQLYEKLQRNDFIDQDELVPLGQIDDKLAGQELIDQLIEKINIFDNDAAINIIEKIEMQQTIENGVSNYEK